MQVGPEVQGIAGGLITIIVIVIKSSHNGKIADVLEKRKTTSEQISGIKEDTEYTRKRVDEVEQKTEQLSSQLCDVGEAVVILHEDDDTVNQKALLDKVGVDNQPQTIREGD